MKEVMEGKYLHLFIYLFFLNAKGYFIYFNNSFYNTSNIKGSIFHITTKNYSFFIHSLSLSLSLCLMQLVTTVGTIFRVVTKKIKSYKI